jgi:hypothetical protein
MASHKIQVAMVGGTVAWTAMALVASIVGTHAWAEEFDRSLLQGRWVELFADEKPNCSNALIFEHELSADGTVLTTRFMRNWLLSGDRVTTSTQQVVRATRNTLVLRNEGEPEPGIPVEWEMIFASPGLYNLRADGWQTDEGDFVRRIRCP